MDYHKVLFHLTTVDRIENEEFKDFDDRLEEILQKTQPMLTEDDKQFIKENVEDLNESSDTRYQYICTVVRVLQNIKVFISTRDEPLISVKQFHSLKVCLELVTAIGIIPRLLPGVGIDMAKLCPKAVLIREEKLTDLQKYRRLRFTVDSLMGLYDEVMFRPAILAQIGPLLAALLQLCHAPLAKPTASLEKENSNAATFIMTIDLYERLKKDQEHFKCLFHKFLDNCPESTSMKELMVILGVKGAPKWLRHETHKYLIQQLMQPNGVVTVIAAVCEDVLDIGEHWNKLDTVSRLIATSHGNNSEEYYKSICPQILNLLEARQIKHSTTISNCCITALYEYNSDIFLKNIFEVICDPLLVNSEHKDKIKTENEVEKCIEHLTKCFVTVEVKFRQLPCKLLTGVALPLFSVYNSIRQSACVLKSKLKQLILRLLHEESFRIDLFAAFLGHSSFDNFGNRLKSKFGPTGGIEITGTDQICKYEECAYTLFDLISSTDALSTELFSYLLKFFSEFIEKKETEHFLETEEDSIERFDEKITVVKLLCSLANRSAVQEKQIENPKPIISFVTSLYSRYVKKLENSPEDDDSEILYISLMLVKMILSERRKPLDWTAFNDFVKFLKECRALPIIPSQLSLLTRQVIELIETEGKQEQINYQDLSVSRKPSDKFEEALKDLADPLLPVRAHGLVALTKLIETKEPCAVARKPVLLQLFKENLKHEDSFIYLVAINGLCALATSYPQVVIETLVYEYINMPERVSAEEITVETRAKLGEILVKVTRALGEMASAFKNILINGFLCATRDPDSLVRASSLSCLGELCKVLGFRLGDIVTEVIYCISCIVKTDKAPECRRAAVMVSTLLLRGLGKHVLISLGKDLVDLFRGLKYLRDNDEDPVLRLHAQLALEELDSIVRDFLLSPPKLQFLIGSP